MAAISNIPRDIQESIRDVLDKRVKVSVKLLVKLEIRADRHENRVLALSPCRFFLLSAKVPSKLENSFHFLDIQAIESKKPNQLMLIVEGKPYTFLSLEANSDEMDVIITHIGISLKQIFSSFPLERLILKIDVQPADRLKTMTDMIKNVEKKELTPCGGFTTMYQCMCDYHGLPFREEVAWDVDTIYLAHDSRELRLQDFDHLNGKDLVPIIGVLEHNSWFKRFNASNVKLTVEACNEIIRVMKRNAVIEEVNLSNTGIKIEFVQKFALAIISNSGSQLTSLDLSNNLLEDKAVSHLLGTVKLLPCGLTSFDLSKTGISTRCLNKIGEVFAQAPNILATLTTLKVNDNGFKGEDFPMLYNCLAQQNAITYLDLSFTDCALDALCDPLLRGCPNLVTLKASKTVFTHKRNKDVNVPQAWKQLFSSMCFLEHLDLSSCKLPVEALKDLLLGLSSNRHIRGLCLDLNSNEFGGAGANVLASCISTLTSIKSLDISNNNFDIDLKGLLPEIAKNSELKHLSIGRNFVNIKPKHMPDVMDALTLVLHEETSTLESLSLADSKLKADTTYIINALGSNNSLQELDISGNSIGDLGARLLAKALLLNTKLLKVVWDKNNVSAQGFEDIAEALQKNMTLRKMPYPINDASAALKLYTERTEIALQKIESFLQRNHSTRRFASDNAYRLQQGFLISSTQQMVDRLVVQVQDTVNALHSLGTIDVYGDDLKMADKLVADANNSRQLFLGLQDIAIKSQTKGNAVDQLLQEMAESLRQTIEKEMQKTAEDMLKWTLNSCPAIMKNPSFQARIKEDCLSKSILPKDFTQSVLEGASTDIYNITSEKNLENAAFISDSVIETITDSLTSCHKTLASYLNLSKHKEKPQIKIEVSDEITKSANPGEISPKFVNKRKSLFSRKTRPQSTMGEETPVIFGKPIEDKNGFQNLEELDSASTHLDSREELKDLVELPSISTRPLLHVTKARPRREKMHRPTRPVVATGTTEMEDEINNDSHPSHQAQILSSGDRKDATKESKETMSVVLTKSESMKTKQEDITSKKWKPGFMKKSKEDKQDKESKDAKKSSSSFGTSLSNIFKKKDDKRRPSGSDSADNKADSSSSNISQAVDQLESAVFEGLEVVKEGESNTENVLDSVKMTATVELDSPQEKVSVKKEKQFADKIALSPPAQRIETKVFSLATEEDTSLDEVKTVSKESPNSTAASQSNRTEPKKDDSSSIPPGVAKVPGLSVLGGKSLLQEMKLKQEKRFSRSPLLAEDEKGAPKDKAVKEMNNKIDADIEKEQKGESPSKDFQSVLSPKKLQEPFSSADDPGKKDLNDNTPDSSSSSLSVKSAQPLNLSKPPVHAPRTVLLPKRPVSTAEEHSQPQEIAESMITSTPELLFGDSSGSKPRPTPPVKPRPPILPRPKKRDSDKDIGAEDTLTAGEPQHTDVATADLRTKPAVQDEGVVTDSATLRLSVKDKIKRLSQAKAVSNSHIPPSVHEKVVSLPRNAKLPENVSESSTESKLDSSKNGTRPHDNFSSPLQKEDGLTSSNVVDSSQLCKTDDEIMV